MTEAATLLIRIGAMGDIIHTLPAAASLKASFPGRRFLWLVAERWLPLLKGNPAIDELIVFDRRNWSALRATVKRLRQLRITDAIDFQGLMKSALAGWLARPGKFFGFDSTEVRERPASWFYTTQVPVVGPHRVDRNMQLAFAAGATTAVHQAWIPEGRDEGSLPAGPFVLAAPFAGWAGKEWPLERFDQLGQALESEGLELVANVPLSRAGELASLRHVRTHTSSLSGLVGAMRRATAVVACDSGPLHLAAALSKRGVALFGPTDPAKNGPFGGTLTVLRAPGAETTYKRHSEHHVSMKAISVDQVSNALLESLARQERGTLCE